jgi:amidase
MLLPNDYRRLDATDLAKNIQQGRVSCREVVNAAISLAELQKSTLNAITAVFDGEIDGQINRMTATQTTAPLAGVPMMIKDIGIFYKGTSNSNGGGEFLRTTAAIDSTITERYCKAGLIICGKTTTPELALNVVTESRAFGPTRNPHNLQRGVGGSSGGAGALVAAGIVPIAHGSDNGGSIRIPASSCGVYGLKPSRGVVPSGPFVGIAADVSEAWCLTNCNHVLTRSVRDSALVLDIEAGLNPTDPRSYSKRIEPEPKGLSVALLTRSPIGTPIASICVESTIKTADRLQELGWKVDPSEFSIDAERMLWALRIVAGASLFYALEKRVSYIGRPRGADDVESITALWAEEGRRHTAAQYVEAQETLGEIARQFETFVARFDLVLTPTLAEPPLPIGSCSQMGNDLDSYLWSVYGNVPFLPLLNSSGGPAASLPLCLTDDGLPIGIHIGSRAGQDHLVLAASATLERAIGFTPPASRWLES